MAPSTNKPTGSDETQGTRSGDIHDTLSKNRTPPDLLPALNARSNSTTAAAAKEPMFDVIIEFNRSFPGGISTARLTLLSAYEKSRKTVDLAAIPADYRTALAA